MKVLVTGGAGFIGAHLVRRLIYRGDDVRVLDSFATGRRESLADLDVDVIEGDIQSYERVSKAVRGCDVVLHEAALPSVPRSIQDPLTTHAVNVTGTLNVLLAARDAEVRRLVYASSSSVYGPDQKLPASESEPARPVSPYAVSKLAGEGFCRAFSAVYGMNCVSLRYFNVFGPGQDPTSQYAAVIPRFVTAALNGRRPIVFGDGEQSRDFTFVDNVVDANLLALGTDAGAGETFNIACGERISLNRVIELVSQTMGTRLTPAYEPSRRGEIRHSHADITRARETLGYSPATSFVDGLKKTIESTRQDRA